MHAKRLHIILTAIASILLLAACSATKHVPDGEYLLDKVSVDVTDRNDISEVELYNFLRQTPNHKVLGFAKLQLATYSLSGRDSTKWYNRWLRRVGQAPVIYDQAFTEASSRQLQLALINSGYLDARVEADIVRHDGKKRMDVKYRIVAGEPHRIAAMNYNISDRAVRHIVMYDTTEATIRPGMLLDRNALDEERGRITKLLRNAGYYDFNREYINYTADTIAGSKLVGLTLNLHTPADKPGGHTALASLADSLGLSGKHHHRYDIRNVTFILANPSDSVGSGAIRDTIVYNGTGFIYSSDRYIRPKVLDEMCYITPGKPYSAADVERTYEALGRLSIIKYINIEMVSPGLAMMSGYWTPIFIWPETRR